jgi:hypothetical protein
MAEAIRALPATKDWDLPDARLWWRDYRAKETAGVNGHPTLSITVDLGRRD